MFGDYDRRVVEDERDDEYADDRTVIIRTRDNQSLIDARVALANQTGTD